jgi:perosamine synthetase
MKDKILWAVPEIGKEELEEVLDSFKVNWLTMGPKVKKFEKKMASYLNVPYAMAVSNGTIALDLALKSIGVGVGDEVIVPAMTYFATASSVSYQNAVPVFVDIERESLNLDPQRVTEAITEKTKAIIFIDYGGNPSDVEGILEVGRKHGIEVLQDAAQSLGAIYRGQPMGAQTRISTMSFHIAKIMSTVEGGMIYTHDEAIMEEILSRRNQGEPRSEKYKHVMLGTNARMMDINAAIGLAQFQKLPGLLEGRKRVAKKYNELLADNDKVQTVKARADCTNAYFFYPIIIDSRDRVADDLRQKSGVDTRVAYPMPVYKQEAYASGSLECRHMDCPVAEEITGRILDLPMYPSMDDSLVERIHDKLIKHLA